MTQFLRVIGIAAAATVVGAPLGAQTDPAPLATEQVELTEDKTDRMTVAVSVDGRGPYQFVVDTGAERTVISRELASELGLAAGPRTRLHSIVGESEVSTVRIPTLRLSARSVTGINAPALGQAHLRAPGILGTDSLKSQRVLLDFKANMMTISPSTRRAEKQHKDTIVVTGRSRFGRLVLVDASLDGEKLYVIVDTGSQMSIGNPALQRRLARSGRLTRAGKVELISVTGETKEADWTRVSKLRIGGVDINNLPMAFTDAHIFRQLRLQGRPAMLLGMNGLQAFERVSVDFASKKVRFELPGDARLPRNERLAGAPRAVRAPAS